MAEETKTAQSDTGLAPEAVKKEETTPGWEEMYKTQQKELQEATEKARKNEEMLDLVSPHVNWNAISGQGAGKEQPEELENEPASKKDVNASIKNVSSEINNKMLALSFRQEHPELKDYERILVGPAIVRLKQEHPYETNEKILERAAKYANDFLKSEREKGAEDARKKAKEKQEEVEAASGLGSVGITSPVKETQGQSDSEYLKERQKRLAKSKGLV